MTRTKKGQIVSEVFKYFFVGLVSIVILVAGYKAVNIVRDKACKTEIAKFEIDFKNIDKSLRFGEKELQSYYVPCNADKIYIFQLGKKIDAEIFNDTPLMQDSVKSGGSNNVFLIKNGDVKRSFYAGDMEMVEPYYKCLTPKFEKISLFVEGLGKSAKITSPEGQPECTIIPVSISEEDARSIIDEAAGFSDIIQDKESEKTKIEKTKQNVRITRRIISRLETTEVLIKITPQKGLKKFRYIESFPKACIGELKNKLEIARNNNKFEVDVKNDPLIMWRFNGEHLASEESIFYVLKQVLDDECKSMIKGLGLADD